MSGFPVDGIPTFDENETLNKAREIIKIMKEQAQADPEGSDWDALLFVATAHFANVTVYSLNQLSICLATLIYDTVQAEKAIASAPE